MREMTRFVSARLDRLLEPRNRFVKLPKFDQVCANIVVRIAEIRIEFNSALALRNGVEEFPLEMISPAEKGVRFGRRMKIQRGLIEFYRAVVIAFHLRLIGILQHFPGARQGLLIHEAIV